jgi:hypothetical protein
MNTDEHRYFYLCSSVFICGFERIIPVTLLQSA